MHIGSSNMADKENGRIMAFLWVGLAYFLTAVIAPLIILKLKAGIYPFGRILPKVGNGLSLQEHWEQLGPLGCCFALAKCPAPRLCQSSCRLSLRVHQW